MKTIITVILCAVLLASCDEKPAKETRTYHVFLYNERGQTLYSGSVTGLSSCRYVANRRIRGNKNPGWDFYCCWEKHGNKCHEKHH